MTLTYIVDDQDPSITYLCPVSRQKSVEAYYRHSWTSIAAASCAEGWFKHTFNGTRIRISSPFRHATKYTVQIDDGPVEEQNGLGVFESPTLPDGEHTILYSLGNSTVYPAFDYLTITSGASTSLNGRTIIVDDRDSSVQLSGRWSPNPPVSVVYDYSSIPYANTTQWSNTPGDSIRFQFSGTSIAVYGVFPPPNKNTNFTASYTIDNNTTFFSLPAKTPKQTLPMSRLFQADLPAGDHTLFVNVSTITGPYAFGFDFITYNASFDALPPTTAQALSGNSKSVGAIVGGTIGGVLGLALLFLLFFLAWRKKKQNSQQSGQIENNWIEVKTAKMASEPYEAPTLEYKNSGSLA